MVVKVEPEKNESVANGNGPVLCPVPCAGSFSAVSLDEALGICAGSERAVRRVLRVCARGCQRAGVFSAGVACGRLQQQNCLWVLSMTLVCARITDPRTMEIPIRLMTPGV